MSTLAWTMGKGLIASDTAANDLQDMRERFPACPYIVLDLPKPAVSLADDNETILYPEGSKRRLGARRIYERIKISSGIG